MVLKQPDNNIGTLFFYLKVVNLPLMVTGLGSLPDLRVTKRVPFRLYVTTQKRIIKLFAVSCNFAFLADIEWNMHYYEQKLAVSHGEDTFV